MCQLSAVRLAHLDRLGNLVIVETEDFAQEEDRAFRWGEGLEQAEPKPVAWGWAADRWGERVVLAIGLLGAGLSLLAASQVTALGLLLPLLFVVGLSSSAVNPVSGRLILGWFSTRERGVAMGIRQTGQPLGVAMAALVLPSMAQAALSPAFLFLAAGCLVSAYMIVRVF